MKRGRRIKWNVTLTRTMQSGEVAYVTVVAKTEAAARRLALRLADDVTDWYFIDGSTLEQPDVMSITPIPS